MNKINVLGIQINNQSKAVIIKELEQRIESGSKTFIVTPYSEFIHRTFLDYDFKQLLNSADFALPDGVAIQWLSYFLNIPYLFKDFYLKIFETYWQVLYSCTAILFYPNKLKKICQKEFQE